MGVGATLIGAIVGAAIGVGLHTALEVGAHFPAPWFAMVTGLITGLGARQATKAYIGHASYLRGAISGLIGLAAIAVSPYVAAEAMSRMGPSAEKPALAKAADDKGAEPAQQPASGKAADEAPQNRMAEAQPGDRMGLIGRAMNPGQIDVKMGIFMAVGALLAYELGRGVERKPGTPASLDGQPTTMTDPSN